jgi:hypothetical protein
VTSKPLPDRSSSGWLPNSPRFLDRIAGAIADGEPVDWEEVDRQAAQGPDGPLVRSLRVIDGLAQSTLPWRRGARTKPAAFRGGWALLLGVLALAALRIFLGAAGLLLEPAASTRLRDGSWTVAASLSLTSLWLILGARSDPRAAYLGGFFLSMASAFAYGPSLELLALLPRSLGWSLLGGGLLAEAFFPVFLWLFVREFPRVLHFSVREPSVNRGLILAVAASGLAFAGNAFAVLFDPDRPEQAALFGWLARDHPWGAFWLLLFGVTAHALVMAWRRRRDASPEERRRATLFVCVLLVTFTPTVAYVLLDVLVPPFTRLSDDPATLAVMRWIVYGFLIAMPVLTAYVVRVQHVMDVRLPPQWAAPHLFLQSLWVAATFLPLPVLLLYLYAHRESSLRAILSAAPAQGLLALAAVSAVLFAARVPLRQRIDRVFSGERPDLQAALARLTASLRESASAEGVAERLVAEVRDALKLNTVRMLARQPEDGAYAAVGVPGRAIPADSALAVLAAAAPGPLLLDPEVPGSAFALLPEADRHWVLDGNVALLVPFGDSAGRTPWLMALGPPRSGRSFAGEDQRFLEGLAPAAALALENSVFRTGPPSPRTSGDHPAGQCAACARLLGSAEPACGCGGAATTAALPLELNGKFRLACELGRGGMGVVYKAEDLALGRYVALKTLPRISAALSARLRTEARSMAALSHPHLALIFGAESWRGTPVLVMEYLAGGTLDTRIAATALPPRQALDLCTRIADALAAMHRRGLLHRDVKPSNVGFSSEDVPKLLDFGLAHLLDTSHLSPARPIAEFGSADPTPAGHVVGTPLYLSPEVLAGGPSGPGQDLWSLALMLYECLAGPNQLRISVRTWVESGARGAFPGLDRLLPEDPLHEPLATFLGDALSGDVRRRPPTAHAFGESLRRVSDGLPRR